MIPSGALREQNVQVAAGSLGRPPVPLGQAFQYTLSTLGRLTEPEEFGNIVVKMGEDGQLTRMRDIVTDIRKDEEGKSFGGIQLGERHGRVIAALAARARRPLRRGRRKRSVPAWRGCRR